MNIKTVIRVSLALIFSSMFVASNVIADTASKPDNKEIPPPPPMSTPSANDYPDHLEPEVRIVPKEKAMHEEYRLNGKLYMIKVIPSKGPPYYLIDPDGYGQFTRSEHSPRIAIPMWVIKEF
jgi:Protein of unknown function (DUF2782)